MRRTCEVRGQVKHVVEDVVFLAPNPLDEVQQSWLSSVRGRLVATMTKPPIVRRTVHDVKESALSAIKVAKVVKRNVLTGEISVLNKMIFYSDIDVWARASSVV